MPLITISDLSEEDIENAIDLPVRYFEHFLSEGYTAMEAYYKTVRRFHDGIFKNYSFPKV